MPLVIKDDIKISAGVFPTKMLRLRHVVVRIVRFELPYICVLDRYLGGERAKNVFVSLMCLFREQSYYFFKKLVQKKCKFLIKIILFAKKRLKWVTFVLHVGIDRHNKFKSNSKKIP